MMNKSDLRRVAVPEIVEKEKLGVLREALEQCKIVGVPLQCGRQWARFIAVETSDAFESEVEAVGDSWVNSPRSVVCGSSINAIAGKDDCSADRVAEIRLH
nr:hypothetical protein [Brevibacterium aurantiacum]